MSWYAVKVGSFLTPVKRPVTLEDEVLYQQVTVMVKGRGAKLRREVAGSEIGTKKQYLLEAGDVVMSKIDARHGAVAVVGPELDGAIVTQNFPVFTVSGVDARFVALMLSTSAFQRLAELASRGTTNRRYLDTAVFLSQEVRIPDLATQRVIVAVADLVKLTCGEVAAAARGWGDAVAELPAAYLESLLAADAVEKVRLGELLTPVKRPVSIEDGVLYRRIGLRSWGRGSRVRDEVDGSTIGTKSQSRVAVGDFIYSKINAPTGNFAVVSPDTDGCIATADYPTFTADPRVLPEYVALLCSSPSATLTAIQQGARGTGQPRVSPAKLLGIAVPLPDLATQATIVATAEASAAAVAYAEELLVLQQQLIDELVTGKITPEGARATLAQLGAGAESDES